jgi:MOSC domain-containing protein YiiM
MMGPVADFFAIAKRSPGKSRCAPLCERMKLNPDSPLASLMSAFPHKGTLQWIGLRPARRAPLVSVNHVEVLTDSGLAGDHSVQRPGGKRQVTLIQAEHLAALAAIMGLQTLDPGLLRRNLVVSGINLLALREEQFEIGGVLFEGAGSCDPCSRMEMNLGPGGYNAVRGHGGIVARVIEGGVIRLDDDVSYRAPSHA